MNKRTNRAISAVVCLGLVLSTSACVHHHHKGKHRHHKARIITVLPHGHERVVISGHVYFLHKGTYYQKHKNGFIVVKPRFRR